MTFEEAKKIFLNRGYIEVPGGTYYDADKWRESITVISKWLEQEPKEKLRIGEWLRMSNLSEQEDDRYKCSHCRNVVHYKDKMTLYTFNSWCGRCGSNNGRKNKVSELAYADQETMMPAT